MRAPIAIGNVSFGLRYFNSNKVSDDRVLILCFISVRCLLLVNSVTAL